MVIFILPFILSRPQIPMHSGSENINELINKMVENKKKKEEKEYSDKQKFWVNLIQNQYKRRLALSTKVLNEPFSKRKKRSLNKWHIDASNDNDNDHGNFDGDEMRCCVYTNEILKMYSLWLN